MPILPFPPHCQHRQEKGEEEERSTMIHRSLLPFQQFPAIIKGTDQLRERLKANR